MLALDVDWDDRPLADVLQDPKEGLLVLTQIAVINRVLVQKPGEIETQLMSNTMCAELLRKFLERNNEYQYYVDEILELQAEFFQKMRRAMEF